MKYRNGFVSNSSSNSFIIAYKKGKTCEYCGHNSISLIEFIEKACNSYNNCDATQMVARGVENIKERIEENWGLEYLEENYPDDPFYLESLKLLQELEDYNRDGFEIVELIVNYRDEFVEKMITNSPDITVLWGRER
jgi:hypothetical protein